MMVDLEELKRKLAKALPAPWIAYSGPPINAQDKNPGRLFCTAPGGTVLAEDSPIQVDGRCTLYGAASWTNNFEESAMAREERMAAVAEALEEAARHLEEYSGEVSPDWFMTHASHEIRSLKPPSDMVCVPREPHEAMLRAGLDAKMQKSIRNQRVKEKGITYLTPSTRE